jgi:hypothetical protein
MEHRRRTLSSVLEEDIENIMPRPKSPSLDDHIEEYTEFVYRGRLDVSKSIFRGILNLICPCCYRKRAPIQIE